MPPHERRLAIAAIAAAVVLVLAAAALSLRYGEVLYLARIAAGLAGCL
jgi:hypothetical protein